MKGFHASLTLVLGLFVPTFAREGACVSDPGSSSCDEVPAHADVLMQKKISGSTSEFLKDSELVEDSENEVSDEARMKPPKLKSDALQPTLVNGLSKDGCTIPERAGLKLYAWQVGGRKRCAAIYEPPDAPKPMPVLLWGNCYSRNKFKFMLEDVEGDAQDPDRFGVAVVFLSDSTANWKIPRARFVSDADPQKCASDAPNGRFQIQYVDDIFKLLESDRATYDMGKVSVGGFSQNAKWSSLIGFCFSHKIHAVVQGGGGIMSHCDGPLRLDTTSCEYSPVYPCYEPTHSVTYCGFRYANDRHGRSMDRMYQIAAKEGYNTELFTFPKGRHVWQHNKLDWIIGCTGQTEKCSAACEADVRTCFLTDFPAGILKEGGSDVHAKARSQRYTACMTVDRPGSCLKGCSPTFGMLSMIENPKTQLSQGAFGPPNSSTPTRPSSSKCMHSSGSAPPVPEACTCSSDHPYCRDSDSYCHESLDSGDYYYSTTTCPGTCTSHYQACDTCVRQFEEKGGCQAWQNGQNAAPYVSNGCDHCEQQSKDHCQVSKDPLVDTTWQYSTLGVHCSGQKTVNLRGTVVGPSGTWGHFASVAESVRPSSKVAAMDNGAWNDDGWTASVDITTQGWVNIVPQNTPAPANKSIHVDVSWQVAADSCQAATTKPEPEPEPTTPPTQAGGTCQKWCAKDARGWSKKCKWSGKCDGCAGCQALWTKVASNQRCTDNGRYKVEDQQACQLAAIEKGHSYYSYTSRGVCVTTTSCATPVLTSEGSGWNVYSK